MRLENKVVCQPLLLHAPLTKGPTEPVWQETDMQAHVL